MIEILQWSCLCWILTCAPPAIYIREKVKQFILSKLKYKLIELFFKALECTLCFAWWTTLFIFADPLFAASCAVISELISRFMKFFNPI